MGVCLAVVKIVGVGSLGILTGQLINQSCQTIPLLESISATTSVKEYVDKLIAKTCCSVITLGGLAAALFSMAFFKAPQKYRHPYLLYAAAGAPLASVALLASKPFVSLIFGKLHSVAKCVCSSVSCSSVCTRSAKCGNSAEEKQHESTEDEEPSLLDSSVYLHVEKEEDKASASPAPAASSGSSCKASSCCKYSSYSSADLKCLRYSYAAASTFTGISFLISTIGIYGDF